VLPSPSDRSQPLVLTDEQAEFVVAFYEIDSDGVYTYRRAALQGAKGIGKSPLGAVIALAEFCGPVAPAAPWVQIAANAEEQAYSNVYALLWALLSENDATAAAELGIDLGRGRLYLKSNPGAKLEAVSSAWGTREGQRVTFALADETHTWLKSNGGHRLARVLRRNAAKVDGRVLELSNAHELGEESTAELSESEAGHPGVLFVARRPSVEPSPEMSDERLLGLLREVYAGAPWVDLPRLLREVRDPGVPFAESLRFYFNVPSAGLLSAVDPITWTAGKTTRMLEDGERIGLGFDGSRSRDATALVACTQDGFLVPLAIEERPANAGDGWLIDRFRDPARSRTRSSASRSASSTPTRGTGATNLTNGAAAGPTASSSSRPIRTRRWHPSSTASAPASPRIGSRTQATKLSPAISSTHGSERSAATRTAAAATRSKRHAQAD
jgi:hypothetical protein